MFRRAFVLISRKGLGSASEVKGKVKWLEHSAAERPSQKRIRATLLHARCRCAILAEISYPGRARLSSSNGVLLPSPLAPFLLRPVEEGRETPDHRRADARRKTGKQERRRSILFEDFYFSINRCGRIFTTARG